MLQCLEHLIEWIALGNVFCGQICKECGEEYAEPGVAMVVRLSICTVGQIMDSG